MKIKKAISFLAAVSIVCGNVPLYQGTVLHNGVSLTATAADYTEVIEGDLTYRVYADHAVVQKCDTDAVSAKIASAVSDVPVTAIAASAFYYCTKMVSVTIPDSITEIGAKAFENCSSLSVIKLPSGITKISNNTFHKCSSLVSVDIPDTVEVIEDMAFSDCIPLHQ